MPLFKEDLDQMQCECGRPGREDPLFIHSQCHIKWPTWLDYFDGILTLRCSKCNREILQITVAKRSQL
jgi:hypothetical protein